MAQTDEELGEEHDAIALERQRQFHRKELERLGIDSSPLSEDLSLRAKVEPRPAANQRQIGGEHYGLKEYQHWDIVDEFDLDYFQGQITKYVMRWKKKNGLQDLQKAQHFLEKYIALETRKLDAAAREANPVRIMYTSLPEVITGGGGSGGTHATPESSAGIAAQ